MTDTPNSIRDILTTLENAIALNIQSQGMRGEAPKQSHFKAEQAINAYILGEVEAIIGEDEPQLTDDDEIASMPRLARIHEESEKEYKESRNQLRQELRNKANKKWGSDE